MHCMHVGQFRFNLRCIWIPLYNSTLNAIIAIYRWQHPLKQLFFIIIFRTLLWWDLRSSAEMQLFILFAMCNQQKALNNQRESPVLQPFVCMWLLWHVYMVYTWMDILWILLNAMHYEEINKINQTDGVFSTCIYIYDVPHLQLTYYTAYNYWATAIAETGRAKTREIVDNTGLCCWKNKHTINDRIFYCIQKSFNVRLRTNNNELWIFWRPILRVKKKNKK